MLTCAKTTYHRPIWSLLQLFFEAGLVMDAMREPAFKTVGGDPEHVQSYHNFPQTPMLLAFRLKHRSGGHQPSEQNQKKELSANLSSQWKSMTFQQTRVPSLKVASSIRQTMA